MKLNQHEISQALWQKLQAHYEDRIAKARSRLEAATCSPDETTRLRERIAEIKEFLAMAQPGRENEKPAD
jgi:uncharacterized protein YciW